VAALNNVGTTGSPLQFRSGLSLRSLSLLAVLCIILYVVGLTLYIGATVTPRAARLRAETIPMLQLFGQIAERASRTEALMVEARNGILSHDSAARERVRATLATPAASSSPLLAHAPLELRELLARTSVLQAEIETRLNESVAQADLDRNDAATRALAVADSLHAEMGLVLVSAEQLGLRGLADRESQLSDALQQAVRTMIAWMAMGVLLLIILMIVVHRRVRQPLRDLEAGLDSVSAGELNTAVRVRRQDELGHLAAHFNDMTGVLRARAAEQGRFAAAGELVAGVAHEVNNPLMAIAALADTRLEDPSLPHDLRVELGQIRRQARRAGKLLSGLLRFVRAREPLTSAVALNDVARSAVDLVSYRFGVEEIEFELRLDDHLPPARGAAVRLEQVIVNLLSNALDSLAHVPPPRSLLVETWRQGEQAAIAVTDKGTGIAPEMRSRMFHPFASTKGAGGTGLGLYISREIIRELGGDLIYQPGEVGARFVVTLPLADADAVDAVARPVTALPPPTVDSLKGWRILLVDDEEVVRSPIARFLGRRGATVYEASDGIEALAQLDRHEVDAILADLRMPRMDGAAFCAELARHRPGQLARVILLSGDLSQLQGVLPVPAERVLAKPVELVEIEAAIRRLDG
jgi:C4-dicarboxylate-specific signal transduction histidine kinase/CheY-like chemotaxis protein